MDFAPGYLIGRLIYRIFEFFHHWYIDGSESFRAWVLGKFEELDQVFAVKVTAHYFFQPLYKDYTFVGRVLGVIFRSIRILIGVAVYVMFGILCALSYLAWLAIPLFFLVRAAIGFFALEL